jgi:soluble lytic murein transglycosylase-like protein
MRPLIILLAVVLTWMAAALPATAETPVLVKAREGSLVLGGADKGTPSSDRKNSFQNLLAREMQVYTYRGATSPFSQPSAWGQSRISSPLPGWQRPTAPYLEALIQKYAARYGVDPSLVRAVMRQESGFNPYAVSHKGAQGLMQLMPGTAALMGVTNPFDPEQNIAGGVGYLRHCLDSFGHNVPLAVAAYNAGPGRVARCQGVPAIRETQNFVKNVMGNYTGRAAASPLPEPKASPFAGPKATVPKTAPVPQGQAAVVRPSLNDRILPTHQRAAAADADGEKGAARPRAKVIEVRYPSGKPVVVAQPAWGN